MAKASGVYVIAGGNTLAIGLVVVGGLIFSQVITLYITPVIYLFLDRYSGSGPMTDAQLATY